MTIEPEVLRYRVDKLEQRVDKIEVAIYQTKESIARIEAGMVFRGSPLAESIDRLDRRFDDMNRELDVKKQVDEVLEARNVRGASVRTKLLVAIPGLVLAVVSILALLPRAAG